MIGFIFLLTLRQLIGRRSTLLLAGLAALPVLLAIVFRLSDTGTEAGEWTAQVLYLGLVVTAVLPLTALLLGTCVLGDEFEDGTAVYLLTKPLPRWQILAPKLAAAWLLTASLVLTSTVVSGVIALKGGDSAIITGFGIAMVIAALAYCTVFVVLSVATTRALIAGLIYVFLWEGAVTGIFEGVRYLSIRHTALGIADWIAAVPEDTFDAYVGGETAAILLAVAIIGGALFANRKLEQVEVRESS
ncbi:MAG: ABC transporter permease subunit [Dehalococcoidia bacterium]|nr:ABC transporter permease subunit [Dehalococcoidia bacterium]